MKKFFYEYFIVFLIVLQLLLISPIVFFPDSFADFQSKLISCIVSIIVSWIYFYFYSNSDKSLTKFHIFFPNYKSISIIMRMLKIKTYNYNTFCEEYERFVSKKPFDEFRENYVRDEMWYILIDHGNKMDPKERSRIAKRYSMESFCAALELKRLLRNQHEEQDILERLHNPYTFDFNHFISIANRWFNESFEHYYLSYIFSYQANLNYNEYNRYSILNPSQVTLVDYIYKCLYYDLKPTFIDYLKYSIEYDSPIIDNDIIHDNFKKLLDNQKTF